MNWRLNSVRPEPLKPLPPPLAVSNTEQSVGVDHVASDAASDVAVLDGRKPKFLAK